ncbi:MAG: DNA primase [Bacteroidaceae bacterium]|nr:DNA primase [Bacteroidaceae bacterium]
MIDQATIDKILDAAQIVDVVSDFVTLRKRGVNYVGLCPFHDDRTPSFSVSPARNICKCFACGKGGNPVHFIMEHEQITYIEALKYLAKKYGIEVKERELSNEERQAQNDRESAFIVNQFARDYYHDILLNNPDGRSIGMAYFRSRGFRDDIIEKFQLGYALQQRDAFPKTAIAKGYNEKYLTSYESKIKVNDREETVTKGTGICYKREDGQLVDRYAGRVIFPWISLSGKVVAFGGRLLDSRTKGVAQKYVNSPDSEIFHKERELYGIFQAKKAIVKEDCVYMVEGYTDVISMHQCGVENVVANSGTALSKYQINILHRFTNNIVLLYDGDEAGIHAATRSAEMLLQEGMTVKVCLLPDGDDPDSFARKHTAQEYRQFIDDNATDYIRFKTNLLLKQAGNDPLKRGEAIREITKAIAIIPEAIMRDVFIKEAADMLGIEEKRMVGYVADQRKTNREAEDKRKAVAAQSPQVPQNQDVSQGPAPLDVVSSQSEMRDAPPMPPIDDLPNRDMSPNREEVQAGNELISANSQSAKALYKYEFHIMQLVVRYGEKIMCELTDEEGNNTPVTVIDFVNSTLEQDDMVLTNPLFREMLKLAVEHQHETDFSAERYFINHPNTAISQMALELVSERYQLSKYHSKYQTIVADDQRLQELSTEITISYKYAIVNESLQEVLRQLQDPAIAVDGLKCAQTIKRYTELREIQAELAKRLGERVVLTF